MLLVFSRCARASVTWPSREQSLLQSPHLWCWSAPASLGTSRTIRPVRDPTEVPCSQEHSLRPVSAPCAQPKQCVEANREWRPTESYIQITTFPHHCFLFVIASCSLYPYSHCSQSPYCRPSSWTDLALFAPLTLYSVLLATILTGPSRGAPAFHPVQCHVVYKDNPLVHVLVVTTPPPSPEVLTSNPPLGVFCSPLPPRLMDAVVVEYPGWRRRRRYGRSISRSIRPRRAAACFSRPGSDTTRRPGGSWITPFVVLPSSVR